MELRQLEYFVAVAEELSFSRAAERLHVAQPSVSEQIKLLETEFGLRLFHRTSRSVALAPAGQELLPLARELVSDAQRLREQAQLSARRIGGRLRIGFLADEYANETGDRLIALMRHEHPRLELEFAQVDFAEHHVALESGLVDVTYAMGPIPHHFVSQRVGSARRLLAISASLIDQDEVRPSPATVARQAVVLPNHVVSHDWRRFWSPPDAPTGQVFVVGEDTMEQMLAAVGAKRGVAIVPEYVSRYYPQPGVTFVPLEELAECTVEMAALAARRDEPVIAAILDIAKRAVADKDIA